MFKPTGISVIICCYNSEKRLPETLDYISKQQFEKVFPYEILIVDNNSNDSTKAVVKNFIQNNPKIDAKYVFEGEPGLSYARKSGYDHSKYNLLTFVDDDNSLFSNYLEDVFQSFQDNSEIGILGGEGIEKFENGITKPEWFNSVKENFATGLLINEEGQKLTEVPAVYGAGFTIRKDLWQKLIDLGFISLLSDRKGKELSSGGDTELCYAFRLMGKKVFLHKDLKFYHYVPTNRLNWDYVKRLNEGFGKSKLIIDIYNHCLTSDKHPQQDLRLPLWLDRYIHLKNANRKFKKNNQFNLEKEGDLNSLLYLGQLGEIKALWAKKTEYNRNIDSVLKLKESFQIERQKELVKKRGKLTNKDFSIIANNCWGAEVYKTLDLPFTTPFIGLYFYAPCYIKLLKDFNNIVTSDLSFTSKSKYFENSVEYPIGLLEGEIEVHFLHYSSEEEARMKWGKRVKRINFSNCFFKFDDRDNCTTELIKEFHDLPFNNKISFSNRKIVDSDENVVIKSDRYKPFVRDGLELFYECENYIDIVEYINTGNVKTLS